MIAAENEAEEKNKNYKNKKIFKDQYIPKLQALMEKIEFTGRPKIIDLSSQMLMPENLVELKTTCLVEDEKMIYLFQFL